jgi:hypothetical protein
VEAARGQHPISRFLSPLGLQAQALLSRQLELETRKRGMHRSDPPLRGDLPDSLTSQMSLLLAYPRPHQASTLAFRMLKVDVLA